MLVAGNIVMHFAVGFRPAYFGDCEAGRIFIGHGAHTFDKFQRFRLRHIMNMLLEIMRDARRPFELRARRIVAQRLVMHGEIQRVQSEAVNTHIQPEPAGCKQRILHITIMQVQIRLAVEKIMQIILLAPCAPCPCAAAKNRQPIIRRRAVRARVGPNIPICFFIVAAALAFDKPFVLVR